MTKRPGVFSRPTRLWHPHEGWVEFPAGEQDPGPAWSEQEGGDPAGAATLDQAVKDLRAAQAQIARLQQDLETARFSQQQVAAERDAANAAVKAMQVEMEDLRRRANAPKVDPPEVHDKRTLETPAERAGVEIPADWGSLPFFSQKAIAAKLTDQPVRTKEDVRQAIEAHLQAQG